MRRLHYSRLITAGMALALGLLAGCATAPEDRALQTPPPAIPDSEVRLTNTWSLFGFEVPGSPPVPSNNRPTLKLAPNNMRFTGNAGCNDIQGELTVSAPSTIRFSDVAATRSVCPDMALEYRFLDLLDEVNRYSLEGDQLILLRDDRPLMVFTPSR